MIVSKNIIFLLFIIFLGSFSTFTLVFSSDYQMALGSIDYLNLDGCQLMFYDSDGNQFELVNYDGSEKDFVFIVYKRVNNLGSTCMAGEMIEIVFIIS